jgi:hypothetical protein
VSEKVINGSHWFCQRSIERRAHVRRQRVESQSIGTQIRQLSTVRMAVSPANCKAALTISRRGTSRSQAKLTVVPSHRLLRCLV